MDAKVGEYCVTPRNGKAVEINAMWYNALKQQKNLQNYMVPKNKRKNTMNWQKNVKRALKRSFTIKEENAYMMSLEIAK